MKQKNGITGKGKSLADRYKTSYETRDKGGSTKKDILDWKKAGKEVKFYQPAEGRNSIVILPYAMASKNHPAVANKQNEIGDLDYMLDIWVHRSIGPNEQDCVCLKRNYNKACPICEEAFKLRDAGDKDGFDGLKASRKVYYNVINPNKPDDGVQVFAVSHYLFEKELIESRNDPENFVDGEPSNFADPEEGCVIKFRGEKKTFGKREYLEYKDFRFVERKENPTDEQLEAVISFDDLMLMHSADELTGILFGEEADEDEDPPAKSAKAEKPAPKKAEDEDDQDEDDQDEDDQDDEDPPAKTQKTEKAEKPAVKAEKPTKKGANTECPSGHKFGVDTDDKKECSKCDCWDPCMDAQVAAGKK